jgi:hypothetical protein
MPLSEHEQRILADIEAQLRADDPVFVAAQRPTVAAPARRRRIRLAVLGLVVGFALLIVGLQSNLIWGVLGFGLLLGSVYQLLVAARGAAQAAAGPDGTPGGGLQRYLGAGRRRGDQDS